MLREIIINTNLSQQNLGLERWQKRRRGHFRPSKVITEGSEEWKDLKFLLFYKEILNSETFKYIYIYGCAGS